MIDKTKAYEDRLDDSHSQAARAGNAALSLLEALLLMLLEKKVLEAHEVDEMFEAAILAHRHHVDEGKAPQLNEQIVSLLRRLQTSGNSVRLNK